MAKKFIAFPKFEEGKVLFLTIFPRNIVLFKRIFPNKKLFEVEISQEKPYGKPIYGLQLIEAKNEKDAAKKWALGLYTIIEYEKSRVVELVKLSRLMLKHL